MMPETNESTTAWEPIKATGSHLYRYSQFTGERREWLRQIILQHRLYVPTVAQLNDPADGRPKLARQTEDQLFRFLYNGPCGVLGRNPRLSVEDQVREAVILDFNISKYGAEKIQRGTVRTLYAQLESFRIYSLSKRYDNMNLWAKYAADHQGYCLEFANEGAFFQRAREVRYGDSLEMDINNPDRPRWLFCKKQEWNGEEEVRVLLPRQSNGEVKIEPQWLTRVILGRKMPEEDRAQIRKWAEGRHPQLTVVNAYWDELDQALRLC